jgi:hypothetical protein
MSDARCPGALLPLSRELRAQWAGEGMLHVRALENLGRMRDALDVMLSECVPATLEVFGNVRVVTVDAVVGAVVGVRCCRDCLCRP